jgi:hypothetical protein
MLDLKQKPNPKFKIKILTLKFKTYNLTLKPNLKLRTKNLQLNFET